MTSSVPSSVPSEEHLTEAWRKATQSESGGCVWVRLSGNRIEVAGSSPVGEGPDLAGPINQFTPHEWRVFLAGVRGSQRFDLPDGSV
ncbi:DUF397 domain-containing protein [Nonomuraea sp. NPDC049758]|uniref:DUF397 domain-containing protein n=1 Tax=Nonomuraea sp. NPDC049758 TaxID=3154360 RepID=UPI00343C407B